MTKFVDRNTEILETVFVGDVKILVSPLSAPASRQQLITLILVLNTAVV